VSASGATRPSSPAASIIDNDGVDAATTRAIADRAGVSYPSLYRFFADREEILDRLLERHLADLDTRTKDAERAWDVQSPADLISRELDFHVNYYRENPSAARLWIDGRTSPTVISRVRSRIASLAERMHTTLVGAGFIPNATDPRIVFLAVELGDRILDLAFRNQGEPDDAIISLGRTALTAYITNALGPADAEPIA
jgi:AcrR family transcriptional regulator